MTTHQGHRRAALEQPRTVDPSAGQAREREAWEKLWDQLSVIDAIREMATAPDQAARPDPHG